jgi:hypothetical protein
MAREHNVMLRAYPSPGKAVLYVLSAARLTILYSLGTARVSRR